MKIKQLLLSALLLGSTLTASESILTNITFNMDDDGNLNPSIFVPVYYGDDKEFYSAIGYTSGNTKEIGTITGFNDSKNALVSNSKDLLVNYLTYSTSLLGKTVSIGATSNFSKITNNEFGYIHDSADFFGNGTNYYIAFDNDIELDIQRHSIMTDVLLPFGDYFSSRLAVSLSPYTSIGVKQSTLFKPLVTDTGTSSSATVQDLAYNIKYEAQIKTGTFFDIGLLASYDNQPLKYDIAQLATSGASYIFESATIDTTEITTNYLVKIIFDKEMMGGLNPSIGYGIETLDRRDNISGQSVSSDRTKFMFGVENRF